MRPLEDSYPEIRFGGFSSVDGTVAFYSRVNALLQPEAVVLDVGCGRGLGSEDPVPFRRRLRTLRGKCRRVIGIDLSPEGERNPGLDEFRLIDGPDRPWPVPSASIDLCLADHVLEHVGDPDAFLAECRRALRPGGCLCVRTPNALSYAGAAARLIPNRLHARVLRRIQPERKEEDVFPTCLACNTAGRLRRALARHGFDACVCGHEDEMSYLAFSRPAFAAGRLIRAVTPAAFRSILFGFGRKR